MENNFISIKNWVEEERPREKMADKGKSALTDAELLAILISTGSKNKSAIDLAKEILSLADNDLQQLGRLSPVELQQVNGIGQAKAITIAAALELGSRRQSEPARNREKVTESSQAAEMIIPYMKDLNHEVFRVIYLNQANKVVRNEEISSGGMTGTVADLRLILKKALLYNSNQIIIAHNHPSGNLQPSAADKELTRKLKEAASFMDIKLLDHLIIGGSSFLSMSDEGYM
jgi:DNA repair protein RadC